MKEQNSDILASSDLPAELPPLYPGLRLLESGSGRDGKPAFQIFHPVSNQYYKIGWEEFEILSRWSQCGKPEDLVSLVNASTPLKIDEKDIQDLIAFLSGAGLLAGPASHEFRQSSKPGTGGNILSKISHPLIFFTIRLFKPQAFLRKTYPAIRPLLSAPFVIFSLGLLFVMIGLTIPRYDEFANSFVNLLSWEGAILFFITLFGVKVLHEFGHAFTAYHYGVAVPHMGVALIVFYPILYTETTSAWKLKDKKSRIKIGLAGIMTELVIAAYALFLWHVLPGGTAESVAFTIVAIALAGSLLVNLNPLMRFDGYYVLSDALAIENLHTKSFEMARWWLRKILFGLPDEKPFPVDSGQSRFLIIFGWATLLYRFVLFVGIALLVYWMFFKPLGLILMILELFWFIFRPLTSELYIWWRRRAEIMRSHRSKAISAIFALFLVFLLLPVSTQVQAPAIAHFEKRQSFFPPGEAFVEKIWIKEGQKVEKGDPLIHLSSKNLMHEITLVGAEIKRLEKLRRIRAGTFSFTGEEEEKQSGQINQSRDIQKEIKDQEERLEDIEKRQRRLFLKAPFSGQVRSLDPELQKAMWIAPSKHLFDIMQTGSVNVTAYVSEHHLDRIAPGAGAKFIPQNQLFGSFPAKVINIEPVSVQNLDWPELSSQFGGPIATDKSPAPDGNTLFVPRQSLIRIKLALQSSGRDNEEYNVFDYASPGSIRIQAERSSPLMDFIQRATAFILREIGLN